MLGGDHHEGNVLVNVKVDVSVGREALDDGSGVLEAAFADEPPGGFGGEEDGGDEDDGPDPLDCEWDSVGPVGCHGEDAAEDSGGDELTEGPAKVDIVGEIGTKAKRRYFKSIDNGDCLKQPKRDTKQDLSNFEHSQTGSKKSNKDEPNNTHHARKHRLTKPKPLAHITRQQEPKQLARRRPIAQSRLPRGRDLVRARLDLLAKGPLEGRLGEECADELGVIALHDDGGGHDDAPEDAGWVEREGLEEGQGVFLGVGILGV